MQYALNSIQYAKCKHIQIIIILFSWLFKGKQLQPENYEYEAWVTSFYSYQTQKIVHDRPCEEFSATNKFQFIPQNSYTCNVYKYWSKPSRSHLEDMRKKRQYLLTGSSSNQKRRTYETIGTYEQN